MPAVRCAYLSNDSNLHPTHRLKRQEQSWLFTHRLRDRRNRSSEPVTFWATLLVRRIRTTRHLLPATRHSPPATRRPPLASRNPIPVKRIPLAVGVAALAALAHQRRIHFTVRAPAPAHGGEVVAAGGLLADGAHFALLQPGTAVAPAHEGVFLTQITTLYAHNFLHAPRKQFRQTWLNGSGWFSDGRRAPPPAKIARQNRHGELNSCVYGTINNYNNGCGTSPQLMQNRGCAIRKLKGSDR